MIRTLVTSRLNIKSSENLYSTVGLYWFRICLVIKRFLISNTFINNARPKLAKNQAKAKKQPEAELLLFENYLLFSSTLSPKNNRRYSKKCTKDKCISFDNVIWLIAIKMRRKMKSRSQRYNVNRPRHRHLHKYNKFKICLSIMMVISIKQHQSNIWSSIHES